MAGSLPGVVSGQTKPIAILLFPAGHCRSTRGNPLGQWPLAMASGHGQWPWPVAMASGHGQWPWPAAMANGHGQWP